LFNYILTLSHIFAIELSLASLLSTIMNSNNKLVQLMKLKAYWLI